MAKAIGCNCYLVPCVILLFAQSGVATLVPLLGGKKLIVGVPTVTGYTEFVDLELNSSTKQLLQVTGYSIDIFKATVSYLTRHSGFNVSYEFQPFLGVTYDQLVEQVYKRKYDMVVGDVSIWANRSKYADFTLPYVDSDVRMLVRVGHDRHLNMWIFLRPFSWDLWLSITIACVFIGATIRFMERKIVNDDTQPEDGSPRRQQVNKGLSIIWLPLAQVVLPDRESFVKNCSKFVLVVWLILAFVLMQSYTASLSSILTLDQLQPSYPSVQDLQRNRENIGYPTGSFIFDMLVNNLMLDKSRLKDIPNMEEFQKALDKGTRNGGVAVIFEETPYIQVFLKNYGSKYMMVGPQYRTGGFGFAFPVNSSLTSYFSRAILNVTQGDLMDQIGKKYLGCSDNGIQEDKSNQASPDTPSLTTYSFAGLFIITGISVILALLVSESHIWRKPVTLAKVYSKKLLLSPRSTKVNHSGDGSIAQGNGSSSMNEANSLPESPSRSPL